MQRLLSPTLLIAALASAPPALASERVVYVRAGHLIDVVEGRVSSDQAILIRGERIERIGSSAELRAPDGAEIVDLSGATVLPGLIDAHAHLTGSSKRHGYAALGWSATRSALFGVNAAGRTLRAGFTTVRNLGADGYGDVALRDAINDGDVPGPRMLVSGPALGITGGHCDMNLLPAEMSRPALGVADGPWAVRQKVRENVKFGADVIKFCATGGVLSKGTKIAAQQYTDEEMVAIVDEARALGLRVAAHAHSGAGIKAAIRAGVASVEHASLLDDEAIELAQANGTTLVMDVYVSDFILEVGAEAGILAESLDKEREVGQKQRESFERAQQAGIAIVFGSDAGVYPHGDNAKQFPYMVKHGMTPMQAIQAATVNAARLLGWEDRVGALAPGRYADLVAVPGNPIENIHLLQEVAFVMKGGAIVRNEMATR